jgi:diaminopimelate decarboxylase
VTGSAAAGADVVGADLPAADAPSPQVTQGVAVSVPDGVAPGQVADLDPHVWASGVTRGPDGALRVAGADVRDIAREHGTPAYVLDEADFRRRARAYSGAFTRAFATIGTGVDVYYAGKAFLSVAVARWAHEEGLRVDTATGGELAVALRAGVPGADIGLHGNNKSDAEIARALDAGVGRLIVDSLTEVERVADAAARTGRRAPVMVRVTTGVHAGGHEYIATAHEDQKFGLSVAGGQAMAALRAVLARPELELLGIHSHIGSQILDAAGFQEAARTLLRLRSDLHADTGHLVPEVDLGGGYGVAYLPGESPAGWPRRSGRSAPSSAPRCRASRSSPDARSSARRRSRSTRWARSSRSPSRARTVPSPAPTSRSTAA